MYSDTTEGKRAEALRPANPPMWRARSGITKTSSISRRATAHIEINGRYAKRFHLKKAHVSGCHADKAGGADYYWLRLL